MKLIDLTEEQVDYIENKLDEYDENYIRYRLDGRIQIGIVDDDKVIAGLDACMTAFKILYVSTVFVDEAYRRKGYGKLLCKALMSKGKSNGAKRAWLQVVQTNEGAYKLYDGLGFKKVYTYRYLIKE